MSTRKSPEAHWTNVGKNAARAGIPIERILTGSEKVDAWIRSGYELRSKPKGGKR